MDLAHPAYAVLGENRSRVLHRLASLTEPVSGRRLHALSGVKALRTVQEILEDLVSIGLVTVRSLGSANAYALNREHVLWHPIELILGSLERAESEIARILKEALADRAKDLALYGSMARGAAHAGSDIDILILWDQPVSDTEAAELLDSAAQRIQRLTGNRAQLLALTRQELKRLVDLGDPLIDSLRSDARSLIGSTEIRGLLRGGRP